MNWLIVVLTLILVVPAAMPTASGAALPHRAAMAAEDYVANAVEIVEAADWEAM